MNTLIVGLGKSGLAAYELLEREGDAVMGVDDESATVERAVNDGKKAALKVNVREFDRLVVSPGMALTHPLIQEAFQYGISIVGEAALALEKLAEAGIEAIGITGTNGKTTVTLLITHVLQYAGFAAHALGNVGPPLTSYVALAKRGDIAVVELSSFQLDTLSIPFFDVGLILNITPDHLDRYASMEKYAESKCRLQLCMKPSGECWVHESILKDFKKLLKVPYSTYGQNPDCTLSKNGVFFLNNLSTPSSFSGEHDVENALAAWIACRKWGVSEKIFLKALESFKKPSHRIEWVAKIRGVDYVNDSKGTNIDATLKAVEAMRQPVLLIVGGVDKGASYEIWKRSFTKKVRKVVALGQAAEKIAEDLKPEYEVSIVSSLADAVIFCQRVAYEGDVILLSPGCSSYDMFRDYAHRGDEFKRIVDVLQEKKG